MVTLSFDTRVLFVWGKNMSSRTQVLQQHENMRSGRKRVGAPLGSVPINKSPSHRPDLVGQTFGSVEICSPEVFWKKYRMYVHTRCKTCGRTYEHLFTNLTGGRTKGCRHCNQPVRFPRWFYARIQAEEQRCNNPKSPSYKNYGARGIKFNFSSVTDAAIWIKENIGVHKELRLDRIDNDRHYEPGNIRWSTISQNNSHMRKKPCTIRLHKFRQEYPYIKYADSTLRGFFSQNMTPQEIIERFYRKSCKPKGKYGTYLTPDPFIVSLHKGY